MPTYFRRDDSVQNALGYAIPNIAVTYYVEPGLTLATVYSGPEGGAATNPQLTDGLGHAEAYMSPGQYTITYSGAQIQTLTLPDQTLGGSGSGNTVTTFAGVPQGTQDGVNRVFTLTNAGVPLTSAPTQLEVWNNISLVVNVGYTISGVTIVYATAPQPLDTIWAQGVTIS
ncbi:MAG TPA: hypothetical protein VN517_03935 [Terriglobales bacterium]|nr:hypothetical protein [Terriglobales bacterium]